MHISNTVFELVSIHAPARGATSLDSICIASAKGFNPRTRTGCDPIKAESWVVGKRFNPRTRTGCDAAEQKPIILPGGFNTRTRTGCDKEV